MFLSRTRLHVSNKFDNLQVIAKVLMLPWLMMVIQMKQLLNFEKSRESLCFHTLLVLMWKYDVINQVLIMQQI